MKKINFAALVIVTICTSNVNAQGTVSALAKSSFSDEFKSATNIRWEKIDDQIFLARFNEGIENKLAYFSSQGSLLAHGQQVPFLASPQLVQTGINKIMKSYEEKEGTLHVLLFYEMIDEGYTRYYVNVGNSNFFMAMLSNPSGDIRILKKLNLNQQHSDTKLLAKLK